MENQDLHAWVCAWASKYDVAPSRNGRVKRLGL